MSSLREGDRINNYILESLIGAGSFGQVWRARHHIFQDIAAIKIPTEPEYVKNLQREGVTIHGLKHPNVVRAIDLDPYADPPYLVMEYVEGPSLRTLIDQYKITFPIDSAVIIMRGVLNALMAAHQSEIIHRDIKPANILLQHPIDQLSTITEQAVKVTDFGLGHVGGVTSQSMMQSGSMQAEQGNKIAGTIAYMSPEQKEGKPIDGRSDLYSCGIVLFEMLTGERPHGGELPGSLRPGVPGQLDEVFRRCYARCDRRYDDAAQMLSALTRDAGRSATSTARTSSHRKMPPLPDTGIRCGACDAPLQHDDNFCIYCGHQIVTAVLRCQHCDGYIQSGDQYCILCGKSLTVLT